MNKIEFHCGTPTFSDYRLMKCVWPMNHTQERCAQLGVELVTQAETSPVKVFCNHESVLLGLRVAIQRLKLESDPDVSVVEHVKDKEPTISRINRFGVLSHYPEVFDHDMTIICELIRNKP